LPGARGSVPPVIGACTSRKLMNRQHWQQVKQIFQSVLEYPPDQRAAFLDEACADDPALRSEVESLISSYDQADGSFQSVAVNVAAHMILDEQAKSVVGQQIGPYIVTAQIGRGGMGEVYLAEDSRLARRVALKLLPSQITQDKQRLERFKREARAASALNHPNILTIHEIGEAEGRPFIATEFIEGETLRNRIESSPIEVGQVLDIAIQVASGLNAAHQSGIVHRDIKPENIMLRRDGYVKILDFGLAKLLERHAAGQEATTLVKTDEGVIMGTARYMSPEQARGLAVDARTDIWSLGVTIYEMVTGRQPFEGATASDVIAAILEKEPPALARYAPEAPAELPWIVTKALTKEREERYQTAKEMLADLKRLKRRLELEAESERSRATGSSGGATVGASSGEAMTAQPSARTSERPSRRVTVLGVGAAVTAGAVIAALVTWRVMQPVSVVSIPPSRFVVAPAPGQPLWLQAHSRSVVLSPDGRYLVYTSTNGRLVLRGMDQLEAHVIPGIENATSPFLSPDSRWIAFFHAGDLKKVPIAGGPPVTLSRNLGSPLDGSWGDNDVIVFSSEGVGLRTIPADGGPVTVLTTLDAARAELAHAHPFVLPAGRDVLFAAFTAGDSQVVVLDLTSGRRKSLIRHGFGPTYVESGHLLYQAGSTLMAVPFDLARLELRGEPMRVSDNVQVDAGLAMAAGAAVRYAISRTGTLALIPAVESRRLIVWVDRSGRETPTGFPPRAYVQLRLAPDGKRVALAARDEEEDIWIGDFNRETLMRLTFDPGLDSTPVWTPDGRQIVFLSNRSGVPNLYRQNADGSGSVDRLMVSDNDQYPNSITPDGKSLLGAELRRDTGYDIMRFPLAAATDTAGSPKEVLVSTPGGEWAANISPDGRYFAYQAEDAGRWNVFVRTYPDVNRGRWQISTAVGLAPVWARSGRELFYLDGSNTLMAVPVRTSETEFSAGNPVKVFDGKYWGNFYSYDVSRDGQRFLMIKESSGAAQTAAPPSVVIVLNWQEELKQRVTTR
jgi:eukaryotic-like serine/threonine-protein kinase